MNSEISALLAGSYDLHVHASPDTEERRMDVLETAKSAYEAEMGGFVLRSIEYPTGPISYVLNKMYPGLDIFGSISLDKSIGGINPDAVEIATQLGAKAVWMPIFREGKNKVKVAPQSPSSILNDSGELTKKVTDVLEIISDKNVLLGSGNLPIEETILLFEKAREIGVRRMIASYSHGKASIEEQNKIISLGAYLEYPFLSCMPSLGSTTPEKMKREIKTIGASHCIITTNFGQPINPPPAEGMRMAIGHLIIAGLEINEIETLVKTNPIGLIK